MSGIVVGMMTTPDHATAERIVGALLEQKLIACGNIAGAVDSSYRWQGEIERADEVLVILKTTESLADRVIDQVGRLHPYDVPEVLFFTVSNGHAPYLAWVRESVASDRMSEDDAKKKQS